MSENVKKSNRAIVISHSNQIRSTTGTYKTLWHWQRYGSPKFTLSTKANPDTVPVAFMQSHCPIKTETTNYLPRGHFILIWYQFLRKFECVMSMVYALLVLWYMKEPRQLRTVGYFLLSRAYYPFQSTSHRYYKMLKCEWTSQWASEGGSPIEARWKNTMSY